MRQTLLLLTAAALLAGCTRKADDGPVAVSVIGELPKLAEARGEPPSLPQAALLGAVAQGLVRFDANAQIAPGLAIRWAISENGLYYTFRLEPGGPAADQVAVALKRRIAAQRRGDLGFALDAIDELVAVTPEVIEIRLKAPSADLMAVLARAEFALLFEGKGLGPLRASDHAPRGAFRLEPIPEEQTDDEKADKRYVLMRGERAARAVARFGRGELRAVLGGSFADLAFPRQAGIAEPVLRFDPATGLFGFRIASDAPMLADAEVRRALSLALDRAAIGARLQASEWVPADTIFPAGVLGPSAQPRPLLARAFANIARGRAEGDALRAAGAIITQWRETHGDRDLPVITIAVPPGPGGKLLFAGVALSWQRIGVRVALAKPGDRADLILVDEVASSDQPEWFVSRFLCSAGPPCSEMADAAFASARKATDPAARDAALADAAERIAALHPFIPIAQPVRWSLVAPNAPGFAPNPRAEHPLAPLIGR